MSLHTKPENNIYFGTNCKMEICKPVFKMKFIIYDIIILDWVIRPLKYFKICDNSANLFLVS